MKKILWSGVAIITLMAAVLSLVPAAYQNENAYPQPFAEQSRQQAGGVQRPVEAYNSSSRPAPTSRPELVQEIYNGSNGIQTKFARTWSSSPGWITTSIQEDGRAPLLDPQSQLAINQYLQEGEQERLQQLDPGALQRMVNLILGGYRPFPTPEEVALKMSLIDQIQQGQQASGECEINGAACPVSHLHCRAVAALTLRGVAVPDRLREGLGRAVAHCQPLRVGLLESSPSALVQIVGQVARRIGVRQRLQQADVVRRRRAASLCPQVHGEDFHVGVVGQRDALHRLGGVQRELVAVDVERSALGAAARSVPISR